MIRKNISAKKPTVNAETKVPSRKPTIECTPTTLIAKAIRTNVESNETLILPKFQPVVSNITFTKPSPGIYVRFA